MRQKWLRQLGLVAVLAMLAAACGGGEEAATGGSSESGAGGSEAESDSGSGGASESDSESETGSETEEASETGSETEEASETGSETEEASETESAASTGGGTSTAPGAGDGTLTIGTLLPQTGSLAFLGPPEFAGVDLAAEQINEAGGVLGQDVVVIDGDSGDTTTDIATQTSERLISEGADVIIGAASSGVSLTVIDRITGAGVVQISPANTATDFTTYEDQGLYFRTAPSDVLQGRVLGEVIVEDGNATVGILALQDPYGEGLAEFVTESVSGSGGEVVETIIYDPNAANFDAEVQQMVAANPDAIVVIGFDESARILTSMIESGIGPGDKNVYGSDGNMGNALGEQFAGQAGALEGMRGTTPLVDLAEDFRNELLTVDPNLQDFNYAAESYDAVTAAALAAVIAESDAGPDIAEVLADVSRGGEKCMNFEECMGLIEGGTTDIDYDGISGPIEWDEVGDPASASFGILEFGPENTIVEENTEYRLAEA